MTPAEFAVRLYGRDETVRDIALRNNREMAALLTVLSSDAGGLSACVPRHAAALEIGLRHMADRCNFDLDAEVARLMADLGFGSE